MVTRPKRPALYSGIRAEFDKFSSRLPAPRVNPDALSLLSLVFSIFFLPATSISKGLAVGILLAVFLLDFYDGVTARKYGLETEKGRIIDVYCDRLSEGLILVRFFNPWFFLFLANSLLVFYFYPRNRHIILPLRAAFFFWFAFLS